MLTGEELGLAIGAAIKKLGVSQKAVAVAFGITQPSVSEWIKYGRIGKQHIPKLLDYFKDVAGPAHWGLPFSDDEFALVLDFREMHQATQKKFLASAQQIAAIAMKDRQDAEHLIPSPPSTPIPRASKKPRAA